MLYNTINEFCEQKQILVGKEINADALCSFRVGGIAKFIAYPDNVEKYVSLIRFFKSNNIDFFILGKGSNVVFPDEDFEKPIISTSLFKNTFLDDINCRISACVGASITNLSYIAEKESMSGFEFAYGIPGSVGGALYMNAGAFGGEIKDILYEVDVYDSELDTIVKFSNEDCKFSYRNSIFREGNGRYYPINATFSLIRGNEVEIRATMDEIMAKRKEKQPLDYPSAGSTFKRPDGYFAGKLIEDAGLKGEFIGGAEVSKRHAGFVINKNNATAKDIKMLVEKIKKEVNEQFGVLLECEIEFL